MLGSDEHVDNSWQHDVSDSGNDSKSLDLFYEDYAQIFYMRDSTRRVVLTIAWRKERFFNQSKEVTILRSISKLLFVVHACALRHVMSKNPQPLKILSIFFLSLFEDFFIPFWTVLNNYFISLFLTMHNKKSRFNIFSLSLRLRLLCMNHCINRYTCTDIWSYGYIAELRDELFVFVLDVAIHL